jgi:predicted membrane chloride channel (bestrophin family)
MQNVFYSSSVCPQIYNNELLRLVYSIIIILMKKNWVLKKFS